MHADDDAALGHDSEPVAASSLLMCLTGDSAPAVWVLDDLLRQTDASRDTAENALALLERDGLLICFGPLVVPTRAAVRGDVLAL